MEARWSRCHSTWSHTLQCMGQWQGFCMDDWSTDRRPLGFCALLNDLPAGMAAICDRFAWHDVMLCLLWKDAAWLNWRPVWVLCFGKECFHYTMDHFRFTQIELWPSHYLSLSLAGTIYRTRQCTINLCQSSRQSRPKNVFPYSGQKGYRKKKWGSKDLRAPHP